MFLSFFKIHLLSLAPLHDNSMFEGYLAMHNGAILRMHEEIRSALRNRGRRKGCGKDEECGEQKCVSGHYESSQPHRYARPLTYDVW